MSEQTVLADPEADSGARRLLWVLDHGEYRDRIASPEAYAAFMDTTSFEEWDVAGWAVNAAYMIKHRFGSGPSSDGTVRFVENGLDSHTPSLSNSETLRYVAPVLPDATDIMAGLYDASRDAVTLDDRALFVRLGIFYTHRYRNGNTRGAAIHESLATRGFDGSEADRRHYGLLALGRQGVIAAGMDIDPFTLTRKYAQESLRIDAEEAGYDTGSALPDRISPLDLRSAAALRPNTDPVWTKWAAICLAERHCGVAAAAGFVLRHAGLEPFLVERKDGGYDFDAALLLAGVSDAGLAELLDDCQARKVGFFAELVASLRDEPNLLGDWQAVTDMVRTPVARS